MVTVAELRRHALALHGTTEAPHFDRAAFKVDRIYMTLAADGKTANLMLATDEQAFKCQSAPDVFKPLDNGWGRKGATMMMLEKASQAEFISALELAYAHAVGKRRA